MSSKDTPYAELGARIARARQATGLSQERFAPLVGVTRRHLIRLENGEHQVSPPLASRIAEITGVEASEFRVDGEAAHPGDPFRDGPGGDAGTRGRGGGGTDSRTAGEVAA